MSKIKGLIWVGVATAVAAVAAVGLPRLARHVPWSVERALGRVAGGPPLEGICRAQAPAESVAAFDRLVKRFYPLDEADRALPLTVDVIRGSTVNAYATLGGHIYVFDGLLQQAQSPEELAGVLAHEVEHVRSRHIIQGVVVNLATLSGLRALVPAAGSDGANAASVLLSLRFSRDQEDEADRLALERMKRGRVGAQGFASFFTRLQQESDPPAILSNHPSSSSRAEMAERSTGYPVEPVLDAPSWKLAKQICEAKDAG